MNSTRFVLICTFLLLLASIWLSIAADAPSTSGVIYVEHDKVAAMFQKSGLLLATNNFKIMTLRRTAPGEVEIHDRDTDIVYVLEGSAQFVSGGKALEPRTTTPGETRGKTIVDG